MKRVAVLAKVLVVVALMAMILGPAQPADAYKMCSSSQTAICNQMGGPTVRCGPSYQYCFSNLCFGQCAGFTNCIAVNNCELF
ncbi:MAG TPA: hypothetical protein DD490_35130 [Acidobacteria bacterium]|nr:hypothetical protein [Acidobacteriota bacterium]